MNWATIKLSHNKIEIVSVQDFPPVFHMSEYFWQLLLSVDCTIGQPQSGAPRTEIYGMLSVSLDLNSNLIDHVYTCELKIILKFKRWFKRFLFFSYCCFQRNSLAQKILIKAKKTLIKAKKIHSSVWVWKHKAKRCWAVFYWFIFSFDQCRRPAKDTLT